MRRQGVTKIFAIGRASRVESSRVIESMGDFFEIVLEPLCDLLAAVIGPMVFRTERPGSSRLRHGKIQTIFDGDPYSRGDSV